MAKTWRLDDELSRPKDWLSNFKSIVSGNCASLMKTTKRPHRSSIPLSHQKHKMRLILDICIACIIGKKIYDAKMKITSLQNQLEITIERQRASKSN